MSDENQYPIWLAECLTNYSFDWDKATNTTFPELLQQITLHDSYWHFTLLPGNNSLLLVIELDAIWNQDFSHQHENWPYLIINIKRTLSTFNDFTMNDFRSTISSAESAAINSERFSEWLEFAQVYDLLPADFYEHTPIQQPLHQTQLATIYGGQLSVIHSTPIQILLYSSDGDQLSVTL